MSRSLCAVERVAARASLIGERTREGVNEVAYPGICGRSFIEQGARAISALRKYDTRGGTDGAAAANRNTTGAAVLAQLSGLQ